MKCIILKQPSDLFFKKALELEQQHSDGEWRYFKFKNKNEISALFCNSEEGIDLHPDFFKYFLGQFSPKIDSTFSIKQHDNLEDFCKELNELLFKASKVFDLSVNSFWIWADDSDEVTVPTKLKSYLSFDNE